MKIRNGFVSNSSSSSFMLFKDDLTDYQYECIINHIECANQLNSTFPDEEKYDFGYVEPDHRWKIEEEKNILKISTIINNFDFYEFLKAIKVDLPENQIFE